MTSFSSPSIAPMPTIWRVSDKLWGRIETILAELDPPPSMGRPRAGARALFDAIIYRGRSGLQWNQLPKAFPNGDPFPDDSTAHRTMQRWIEKGVFSALWALLIEECEELGGVSFEWQSVDTALGKLAWAAMRWDGIQPTAAKTA